MTKDEVLKNLDCDLDLIMKLYEEEKIDDGSVELQMTQTIKSLKGAKSEKIDVDL
jgi:hypothetical protein